MRAIVLAGGLGTRLRQRVPEVPKAMAPVAGRPFLSYLLDRLIAGGVLEIVLALGYRADPIMAHFGSTYRNAALTYLVEREPLGTGGAVAHAVSSLGEEPVLVQNGDTFVDIAYDGLLKWYQQAPVDMAMVLAKVPDTSRYGAVLVERDRVRGFAEKGRAGDGYINAGVYVIRPAVIARFGLAGRFSLETDLLQRHCAALSPAAYFTAAFFIDIGVPEDYERAQRELPASAASPAATRLRPSA
ncbi:MAG: D-glycero-D-manno-heptose 1-phosphate guanosyltransferase [Betaproteobacteria bacterium]|nr:MAG: D-glycero-D-manno-heptose 1-phosphate guanosyltransferase [Betaproteobacteria bacterium]